MKWPWVKRWKLDDALEWLDIARTERDAARRATDAYVRRVEALVTEKAILQNRLLNAMQTAK